MNQNKLWSVVALSTTVVGIPSVGRTATTDGNSPTQPPAPAGDAVNVENALSPTRNLNSRTVEVTQIHTHNFADRQATTLYVRNIPFLIFVGENDDTVKRANAIAAKINQLISNKVDPNQITASWKAGRYFIKVNGEDLVEINGDTRLPDITNNPLQDALQATNRLRRLIGGTTPLREISNIPEQQQETIKQPQQTAKQPQQTAKQPQLTANQSQQAANQSQQAANQSQQTAKQPQQNAGGKVKATSRGMASYYSYEGGSRTASGERFNPHGMTAAHRSLPLGTKVRVTNTYNGRSVVVRINDRGPFIRGRVIDVSLGAARVLGMISSGVAAVRIEVLGN
ncbi:MAG: septal ring lytic transglycosylase RlpA family protein [Heteroscytonema crispum UTEX LB 1556]